MNDFIDKTIVITGGTGLVGSYLIRTLLARGATSVISTRRPSSRLDLLGGQEDQVKWLVGDLLDPFFVEEIAQQADIVIHAAAMVSFDPRERQQMIDVNVEVTRSLVNECLRYSVEHLVFVSSVAALGRTDSGDTITEDRTWTKSKENAAYAVSKYLAEREVWRGQAEGLPTAIINPSIILGGGYWQEGSTAIIGTIARGLPFYGRGATAVVDVRDVVQAITRSLEGQIDGERYIIAGHNITYKSLFTSIARAIGVRPATRPLPGWLGAIGWRVEAIKARLTSKRPMITKETIRTSSFVSKYDNQKSIDKLGMEYLPLEQTILDIAGAYHEGQSYGLIEV